MGTHAVSFEASGRANATFYVTWYNRFAHCGFFTHRILYPNVFIFEIHIRDQPTVVHIYMHWNMLFYTRFRARL